MNTQQKRIEEIARRIEEMRHQDLISKLDEATVQEYLLWATEEYDSNHAQDD